MVLVKPITETGAKPAVKSQLRACSTCNNIVWQQMDICTNSEWCSAGQTEVHSVQNFKTLHIEYKIVHYAIVSIVENVLAIVGAQTRRSHVLHISYHQ